MICKSCNIRDICKTYDFIRNVTHAEIKIESCKYDTKASFDAFMETLEPVKHGQQKPDNRTNNPNYRGEARPDLKAIEKQLNPELEKPEPIKVTCPTCEGTTYDDDLMVCTKCGKVVCSNCGTVADKKVFCKECWEKE